MYGAALYLFYGDRVIKLYCSRKLKIARLVGLEVIIIITRS